MKNIPDKRKIGLIPTIKNLLFGDTFYDEQQTYVNTTGNKLNVYYQLLLSNHLFTRKSLQYLVETGYSNNPAVFGVINKIILAQRNINFIPYWNGKPWKSKQYTLDTPFALQNLLLTGTCVIYQKEIVGFDPELSVLNTLFIQETFVGGKFTYRYYPVNGYGSYYDLNPDKMCIIKFFDFTIKNTQMGLSPLQAALMPVESMREMYIADTSALKNKGSDIMLTNDSDSPIQGIEASEMTDELNKRISGARRNGTVAASTSKLRAIQLGRSAKELALWDGYKIKLRDICNAMQVDSGQFNDPDNKKFANVVESNRALYTDCVIPFTKLIVDNPKLKQMLGYDVYPDVSQIDCLQEAQETRANKAKVTTDAIVSLNAQVQNGTISYDIAIKILVSEWGFDEQEAAHFIQLQKPSVINPIAPQ